MFTTNIPWLVLVRCVVSSRCRCSTASLGHTSVSTHYDTDNTPSSVLTHTDWPQALESLQFDPRMDAPDAGECRSRTLWLWRYVWRRSTVNCERSKLSFNNNSNSEVKGWRSECVFRGDCLFVCVCVCVCACVCVCVCTWNMTPATLKRL